MTIQNNQKGINISEIDTPSIIVDLDIVENNIKKMQNFANDNDVSMRPHSKTNKSPYWAKKQIDQGAIGICCAKLGEAEEMAKGGIAEILIPNQIVGKSKIQRLVNVNKISKVMVAVENEDNVNELSKAFEENSLTLGVIIEVNVGMDRCGLELDEIVDENVKKVRLHEVQNRLNYHQLAFNKSKENLVIPILITDKNKNTKYQCYTICYIIVLYPMI